MAESKSNLDNSAPAPHPAGCLPAWARELKAEFAELRAELNRLRECVKLSGNTSGVAAAGAEAAASGGKKVERLRTEVSAKRDPITYQEAFQIIGGHDQLIKHSELSRKLQSSVRGGDVDSELRELLPRDFTKRTGFSTKLINQPYVRDLEELYAHANRVYSEFDETVRTLARKTNSKALVPAVKGEVRSRMKAIYKYREESTGGIAWYRLTDLVRATLEYADIPSLYKGAEDVLSFFGNSVQEFNDRYQAELPGGYRDMQLVVLFKGHMCELQLSTEPMTRAKETTGHRDFEVMRELRAAVRAGDLKRVLNALEFGRAHLGSKIDDRGTALSRMISNKDDALLHHAADQGHADILHALLLHGADVDMQNDSGDTALHLAVFAGHERCVWVLLDVGKVNVDITNAEGQTPLLKGYLMLWKQPHEQKVRAVTTLGQVAGVDRVKAARQAADEHVRKLFKPSRALVDHAADGNVEKMFEELHNYADPNSTDRDGQSALQAAVTNGHVKAVQVLLDFKALLRTGRNCLPLLEVAIEANQIEIVKLLINAGASLETKQTGCRCWLQSRRCCWRPLMLAALKANQSVMVKAMIDAGASTEGILELETSRKGVLKSFNDQMANNNLVFEQRNALVKHKDMSTTGRRFSSTCGAFVMLPRTGVHTYTLLCKTLRNQFGGNVAFQKEGFADFVANPEDLPDRKGAGWIWCSGNGQLWGDGGKGKAASWYSDDKLTLTFDSDMATLKYARNGVAVLVASPLHSLMLRQSKDWSFQ